MEQFSSIIGHKCTMTKRKEELDKKARASVSTNKKVEPIKVSKEVGCQDRDDTGIDDIQTPSLNGSALRQKFNPRDRKSTLAGRSTLFKKDSEYDGIGSPYLARSTIGTQYNDLSSPQAL